MPSDQPHSAPGASGIGIVNPLEYPDWDQSVGSLPGAGFFHGRAWARVLHETYGYRPVYFVRNEAGRPQALLPLMEVRSWLTGRRGVALPFTDACEPLAADADAARQLREAAYQYGTGQGWKYLETCGGRHFLGETPASTVFYGHQLDLRGGEAALQGRFDGAVRRAIKKAGQQDGLKIDFSRDAAGMDSFYRLLCLTRKRHGLPPQPARFFDNIQRHVLAGGHGWTVLATHGDRPVAGAVYFHAGKKALYKYGASDDDFQHLRANQLVMWQAIRRYAAEGYDLLDFGRTSLTNEGLRRYKLNWGTTEQTVEYFRYDLRQRAYLPAKDGASGWHSQVFRRLPIPVLRAAGALLYPHMG